MGQHSSGRLLERQSDGLFDWAAVLLGRLRVLYAEAGRSPGASLPSHLVVAMVLADYLGLVLLIDWRVVAAQ